MITSHPHDRERLAALLTRLVDDVLPVAERDELESMLLDVPEAQRDYVDFIALNSELSRLHCGAEPTVFPQEGEVELAEHGFWQEVRYHASNYVTLSFVIAGLFVTIMLLSMALIIMPQWKPGAPVPVVERPDFVARIMVNQAAEWSPESEVELSGITELHRGQSLDLTSGLAELRFDSGARMVLEGPARFTLLSNNSGRLHVGRAVARVEDREAHGFTIETPVTRIVDLGTEFAVEVATDGSTGLYVYEGAVQYGGSDQSVGTRIVAGESAQVRSFASAGQLTTNRPDDWSRSFVRVIGLPRGVTAVSAAEPDVTTRPLWDSYVSRHEPTKTFSAKPVMLVKTVKSDPNWDREAWLGFDLADIEPERIAEVELTLSIAKGVGNTASLSAWEFELLGMPVTSDRPFAEKGITWSSTRKHEPRSLVKFTVAGELQLGDPVTIRDAKLNEFVQQNAGQPVTLVIKRVTSVGTQNVVNAFISMEQELLGPELKVWYVE